MLSELLLRSQHPDCVLTQDLLLITTSWHCFQSGGLLREREREELCCIEQKILISCTPFLDSWFLTPETPMLVSDFWTLSDLECWADSLRDISRLHAKVWAFSYVAERTFKLLMSNTYCTLWCAKWILLKLDMFSKLTKGDFCVSVVALWCFGGQEDGAWRSSTRFAPVAIQLHPLCLLYILGDHHSKCYLHISLSLPFSVSLSLPPSLSLYLSLFLFLRSQYKVVSLSWDFLS